MDKTTFYNSKNNESTVQITEKPNGIDRIHSDYGLWIFGIIRNGITASRYVVRPRLFQFYGISHLLNGNGWIWTEGEGKKKFSSGSLVITTPGIIHDYGGDRTEYREDAISFSGSVADSLFNAGILEGGVFFTGNERRLLPIIELSMNPSQESQIEANIKLQELFLNIYHIKGKIRSNKRELIFENLLDRIRENPGKWWDVKEMARFCSLSESHFRLGFYKFTGISPKKYIDSVKIKLACELIAGSEELIGVIALKLGYTDPFHFSRRFKLFTGLSPTAYRFSMSRNPGGL